MASFSSHYTHKFLLFFQILWAAHFNNSNGNKKNPFSSFFQLFFYVFIFVAGLEIVKETIGLNFLLHTHNAVITLSRREMYEVMWWEGDESDFLKGFR